MSVTGDGPVASPMEQTKPAPRRHHYLPQGYLSNFTCPNEVTRTGQPILYVYEKNRPPRASTIINEACQKDLYTVRTAHGNRYDFEHVLADLDGRVAPVLKSFQTFRETPSAEERQLLATFIGVSFTRTPTGRKLMEEYSGPAARRSMLRAAESAARFEEFLSAHFSEVRLPYSPEQIRLGIREYLTQPQAPEIALQGMLQTGQMIAHELLGRKWQVVYAPRHQFFITSDFPVFTATPVGNKMQVGTGFTGDETEVWFPVGNRAGLRIGRYSESSLGKLPPSGVKMVNRNLMLITPNRLYAGYQSVELSKEFTRLGSRFKVGEDIHAPRLSEVLVGAGPAFPPK